MSTALAAAAAALLLAVALLGWPGLAGGQGKTTRVLGTTASTPAPACPGSPCEAIGSVTGFQTRSGSTADPFVVPFNGKLVAWEMSLSKPKASQQTFFNEFYDSPPQARIAVLKEVPGRTPRYKLLRQGPVEVLTRHLGQTVTFALETPLTVREGNVVGLTIPTWAPAFAVGLANNNAWRASRKAGACMRTADIKESKAQQKVGSEKQYGCFYRTARLLYEATVVRSGGGGGGNDSN